MCGRFSLTKEEAELENRFGAKFYTSDLIKRYNVAPGQLALVLTSEQPDTFQYFKWGLVPSWAKDTAIGNKMINARAETIFEKPSFKNLILKKRCLVICDGFYEWIAGNGKKKQPLRILMRDEQAFAMAGLWDSRTDLNTGEILHTFTIITTSSNSLIAPVHDRMPVILNGTNEKKWLDSGLTAEETVSILIPYPETLMKMYPVSDRLNSAINDSEELIRPAATLF